MVAIVEEKSTTATATTLGRQRQIPKRAGPDRHKKKETNNLIHTSQKQWRKSGGGLRDREQPHGRNMAQSTRREGVQEACLGRGSSKATRPTQGERDRRSSKEGDRGGRDYGISAAAQEERAETLAMLVSTLRGARWSVTWTTSTREPCTSHRS